MRKNRKQILFVATTMLICVWGTMRVHAQTAMQPVQVLTAYDSVGRRIGNVLGFGAVDFAGLPSVAFSKDNTTVVLEVGTNRFFGKFNLFFTTTDCTGTPYLVFTSGFPRSPLTRIALRDGAIYVPDPSFPPPSLPLTFKSLWETGSEVPVCVETTAFETTDAVQAKILANLPAFTPPFSVR